MSATASLGQAGLVERVAAVFAHAASRERFVLHEPLVDDFRT
jgi:hypothetical protein